MSLIVNDLDHDRQVRRQLDQAGRMNQQERAFEALALAIALAVGLVFVLLLMALGSLAEVSVILLTLPDAFVGGILALLLTGETLNVSSAVGFIGLFGIAVQNGLVLIAQTRALMQEGLPFEDALREASIGRVRPKLMTASCAMLGLLPLVLLPGQGGELERPLAIVMIGGLITSTLFTLLALPTLHSLVIGLRPVGDVRPQSRRERLRVPEGVEYRKSNAVGTSEIET